MFFVNYKLSSFGTSRLIQSPIDSPGESRLAFVEHPASSISLDISSGDSCCGHSAFRSSAMRIPDSEHRKASTDVDRGSRRFSSSDVISISLDSFSSFKNKLSPKGTKNELSQREFIVQIADTLSQLNKLRVAIIVAQGVVRFLHRRRDSEFPKIQIENVARLRDSDRLQQLGGVAGLARKLRVNPRTGVELDSESLVKRRRAFGQNVYPKKASKTLLHFLWEAAKDTTLIILMFCAILSLIFGIRSEGAKEGWYEGASIGFAVILVIVVTAVSDYRQSRQFRSLNKEKENIQVQVLRGGRRTFLSIFEIVVGDIVELRIGDQVPADGLFIAGQSLAIDESSMTGETDLLVPSDKAPFLLSGCKVQDGNGSMLVTAVGINTEWGQMMSTINDDNNEQTPLQSRLSRAAVLIGKVGLSVAFLVLVVLLVFYFTGHTSGSGGTFRRGITTSNQIANSVVKIFSIAVTIVVVAVPEGLPLAVTITLAYSMRKMMADKALVRRLSSCETMGSATTICSDKTGTLTMNQMTVVKDWVAGSMSGSNEDNILANMQTNIRDLLFQGIAQNSTGSVFVPPGAGAEQAELSGSPTEKALLSWGLNAGMKFDEMKSSSYVVKGEPFNSTKKRAGVAVRIPNGKLLVHWKGAAEIILKACDKWVSADGEVKELRMEKREELEKVIDSMATASLRCVAFAYCHAEVEVPENVDRWKLPNTELTMLAVVGIKDPCRPGVKKAIEKAKTAGVKVRMVTGDNLATAKAIATECTILEAGDEAVEGAAFRLWNEAEMRERLPKVAVIARALPTDKLLLVQTLQGMGEIVAVTGDGSNDAPALHQANIGLSMGIQGTEVAKESSDIVILDDDFTSVVKVLRWGRSVYSNIQKFLQFQLTVNVAALAVNFVAAVTSGSVPLTAVQLLWVNLIMDTLGALALATEPPTDELMLQPPVKSQEPLITNAMWRNVIGQAMYQVAILLTLQFRGESLLHLNGSNASLINHTVIFNTFVFCQIFNELNARQPYRKNIFIGLFNNRLFIGIVATTIVLQVVMVEFLEKFASTVRLDWQHWVVCIILASLSWPIAFLLKLIPLPSMAIFSVISLCKRILPSWRLRGNQQV